VGPVCDFLEQFTSRGAGDQAASTIDGGKLATDTWHPRAILMLEGGSHYVICMGYSLAYILMVHM